MPSPLAVLRHALAASVVERLALSPELTLALVRQIRVPEAGRGDLALPCFAFAKQLQKSPEQAAELVAAALGQDPRWAKVEAVKAYVNVSFDKASFAERVVPLARAPGYGEQDEGRGKRVVIDFSSPNIAKPLAYHHIRSTVIGAAIGRLYAAQGYTVVGINYLGDWGKQFGLLATGFARYGDPTRRADAKHLVEVYVKSNQEADVAKRKEAITAPAEARRLAQALATQRAELAAAQGEGRKKLERALKSAERKLRELLGVEEDADPLARLEEQLARLEAARAKAEAELPLAEERDREARLFFRRLEEGEPLAVAEWKEFRETSVREFERVYARMGVRFTHLEGESFYNGKLEQVVAEARQKPGTRIDEGAEVVDLAYKPGEPPVILKTRDGTTLYVTRDLAAAGDRWERFHFERSLYVVAADQSLHFEQLFRTLKAMGKDWVERCRHVAFGRIHGMSTRRGNLVFLDEVLDYAVEKARQICLASEKIDRTRLEETVEAVGVGAVVFGDLKNLRTSDFNFDWDEVLNFDGHTGPYVQFSHARTCSIIKKGGGVPAQANLRRLVLEEERAVLGALAAYPDVLAQAADGCEPSVLTRALIDLAQLTASYLTAGNRQRSMRVLVEDDPELRAARLQLVDAVRNVLAHGLAILGVRAPEAM